MLSRVIVAVIAIPIMALIIFFAPLWLLGAMVGVIAGRSTWELLRCVEADSPLRMRIVAALCAFAIPFCTAFFPTGRVYELALFCLFVYLFCELMLSFRKETTMAFETVTVTLFAGGILPVLLSAIVRMGMLEQGSLYVCLPFLIAFSCDSGAYFVGCGIGKHKLVPRLSSNKTVEGSIGGFFFAIAVTLLYGVILRTAGFTVLFPIMAVYGFLGALACQLGDLSFSAIKRLCGIKDYGHILPGHGGMLDRFDSMIWTAPVVELMVCLVAAVTK